MAYSFDRDESIGDGLRRNALSQVDGALEDLERPGHGDVVEAVHDARKRCKKLRALARMVRPHVGDEGYRTANVAFRDAARQLSEIRDQQVMVEVFDDLVASAPDGMRLPDVDSVRDELSRRFREATARLEGDSERLRRARALLEEGREELLSWEIEDLFDSIAGGVHKTYGRAVDARDAALDAPTVENLHEWRKRVKYHWYHLRMLAQASPELLEPWAGRLHDLSDTLGDDHDLAVLVETLRHDAGAFGDDDVIDAVRTLAEGRRAVLQETAFSLGARLAAEDPDTVVERLRIQWEAWKRHGASPQATELADLPA